MFKKILGCHCSTAHKSGDHLILSLNDALTPAMWVINLSENPSLLLKVEESDNGLYVLQKITSDGKTALTEELGYYTKKGHAIRAMSKATQALQKSNEMMTWLWCAGKILIGAALLIFLLTQIGQSQLFPSNIVSFITAPFETSVDKPIREGLNSPTNTQPQNVTPSSDPNAVGVPLSADDILRKRSSGMPF